MARRSKTSLENDIERSRLEENWEHIPKLVEQLSSRTTFESSIDAMKRLLLSEAQLEIYIRNNPLGTTNVAQAEKDLREAVVTLTKLVSLDKLGKAERTQEALLLLCKAYFVLEDFEKCVKHCNQAGADDIYIDSQSKRKSKLVAEGFACKAMALEQLQTGGHMGISDDDIVNCYECAGDIALWLATDQSSAQRATATQQSMLLGRALEIAIQRAPMLLIKNGKLTQGINRFRYLMKVVESKALHSLRKGLARQLSQILLRGVCERSYEKPLNQLPSSPMIGSTASLRSTPKSDVKATINTISSGHTSFPLVPQMYSGESLFFPRNEMEETLLLLLLEEAMVSRDAELSQAPEKLMARKQTVADSESVYDLLTVALVRRAQYGMLAECLDRGMKVAFEEFHLWFQFGLSLISAGKYQRALLVLGQCHHLRTDDPLVCLYAAKLCYNNLHLIDAGIEFSMKVVEMGDERDLSSRGYLALGIGYSLKASEARLRNERQQLQKQASDALSKAHNLDPDDSEALFHLALNQALMRQISKALKNIRSVLKMNASHIGSLHLLSLILSAQKKFVEALEVCDVALMEFPEDLSLLLTKVKLEQACVGGDQALVTCKRLLETWKQVYEADLSGSVELQRAGSGLLDKVVADSRNLKQIPLNEISSQKDSADGGASSIAASVRLEQALSDEAASASIKLSVPAALALQAKLWLAVADVYIAMRKATEASACVQEANLIFPLSPDVLFQRGRICEIRGNVNEAKCCYNNAIAINPAHVPSMQHLGAVYHKLGNLVMAEKVLREAINVEPTAFVAWHVLGVVLEAQNEHEAASECLMTAIDLEATHPIVPFTVIPRLL